LNIPNAMTDFDTLVVGGGAAGFFAAIHAAENGGRVILLEKSAKFLAKVMVSGGGRCNVTHDCRSPAGLAHHYPRGSKFLKPLFELWGVEQTIHWFESRGVALKTEGDGRMFPVSDTSADIADALFNAARQCKVQLRKRCGVQSISQSDVGFDILTDQQERITTRSVVVACGGLPKRSQYQFLEQTGHTIIDPVPSLFTFHVDNKELHALSGLSVPLASVRVEGIRQAHLGPLLITHWGMSGPAILRCSAWLARELADVDYRFNYAVNWVHQSESEVRPIMDTIRNSHPKRKVRNQNPWQLPQRLWEFLINRSGVDPDLEWGFVGGRQVNKMIEVLVNDRYRAEGKSMFKEEFVTAGGIKLSEIDGLRMESRFWPGLHFAGEILDIDGITGGFNFQAAWTTGYLAGKSAAKTVF